jgi:hypothetical protein
MEFRLTYRGLLRATQRDPQPGTDTRTKHWSLKHQMRLDFHNQLKHNGRRLGLSQTTRGQMDRRPIT